MKTTRLLVALAALALAAPAGAEVMAGVLGGSSFASLRQQPWEDGFSFGNHPFFGAGTVADIRLGRRLSLRLEPMLLVKGSDFFIEPDLLLFKKRVTGDFRLTYVELPVLLRFSSREGSIRPYAMAGPSAGYLLKARIQGRDNEGKAVDSDAKDDFKKGDFGLSFGAGMLVPTGRSSMFVEAGYTLGLVNVAKNSEGTRWKSRTILVMAGVTFPLGHR